MASTKAPWMIRSVGAAPLAATASSACAHGCKVHAPKKAAAAAAEVLCCPLPLGSGSALLAVRQGCKRCCLVLLQVMARDAVCICVGKTGSPGDLNADLQPLIPCHRQQQYAQGAIWMICTAPSQHFLRGSAPPSVTIECPDAAGVLCNTRHGCGESLLFDRSQSD
jgi:hypothetical protein